MYNSFLEAAIVPIGRLSCEEKGPIHTIRHVSVPSQNITVQ